MKKYSVNDQMKLNVAIVSINQQQSDFLCSNWDKSVSVFFDWMDKVNGYYQDSWVLTNLRKYIVTKHDLNEWYLLFADKFEGDFDFILKCSVEFIRSKKNTALITPQGELIC